MNDPDLKKFGQRLRLLRLERNLTQEKLAEQTNLHPTYIGGVERGERNIGLKNVLKISRALNAPPSELLQQFHGEKDE